MYRAPMLIFQTQVLLAFRVSIRIVKPHISGGKVVALDFGAEVKANVSNLGLFLGSLWVHCCKYAVDHVIGIGRSVYVCPARFLYFSAYLCN